MTITKKEPLPVLLKVTEAAKILALCRASVHSLIQSGELQAAKVSSNKTMKRQHVRITRDSLCALYKKRFGHPLDRALENPFKN